MKFDSRAAPILAVGGVGAGMFGILLAMGRSLVAPDGTFGVWVGSIWSPHNSQWLADPYSFSHLGHGILFFGMLWLVGRDRLTVPQRLIIAALLEASWEVLENSPIIIDRYRQATIAIGYNGDSVLNSTSDLLMMCGGFLFAARFRLWPSVAALLAMEVGCVLWVRDNLTLNILMLIHPFDAIKAWQAAGGP